MKLVEIKIFCTGSRPAMLVQKMGSVSGGSGSYTYQWQQSADGNNFTIINNQNGATYQPGSLTTDVFYRRVVTSLTCISESNSVKISVQGTLNNFQISADQTICSGTQPEKIFGETPAGGSGAFTYKWEKSTTSISSGFTVISAENGVDYQPQTLTQTTYYRRVTSSGSCSATATPITISVNPIPVLQPVADVITCSASSLPITVLQSTVASPNISYAWTNDNTAVGLVASGSGNIPSFITQNNLKIPIEANISVLPTYSAGGKSCQGNPMSFKYIILPNISVVPIANLDICASTIVPAIQLSSNADTFAGSNVAYKWVVTGGSIGIADGIGAQIPSFKAINNTTVPITVTVAVTPTYTYKGKACSGNVLVYKITVNPTPNISFSIADQTICSSSATAEVELNSATPGATFAWTAQLVNGIDGLITAGTDKISAQTLISQALKSQF